MTKKKRQASKRQRHVRKACRWKVRYPTLAEAQRAAMAHGLGLYYCRACRGYHMTKRQVT